MTTPDLRWLAKPGTTTEPWRLQVRDPNKLYLWHDVPVVLEPPVARADAPSAKPDVPPAALLAQILLSAGLARRRIMDARSGMHDASRHVKILVDDAEAHLTNITQAAERLSAATAQDRTQEQK